MRIQLVLAAHPEDPLRKNDPFMPLSLPLLAASAPAHDYVFVDMLAGEEPLVDGDWDLVGVSVRITAQRTGFLIADRFRAAGVPVVLGGAQVSSEPLRALEHADAVAVGEGEQVWPLILEDMAAGQMRDLYVARPGDFDAGGRSVRQVESWTDLAAVPKVAMREPYRKKYFFDTVYAARGCPIDCDFCSVPHLFGKKVRFRPVDDVVAEIDTLGDMFYLMDDTVFGRPAHYPYYLELYERLAHLPRRRLWTGQANLDAAATEKGREVIRRAARSGLVYAAVGMESLNPAVLEKNGAFRKSGLGGSEDVVDRMRDHIRFIQDQGVVISGWFTMGYEEDGLDDFARTLDFCRETNILPILCPLEALPGTRLYERLTREGRVDTTKRINIVHPSLDDDDILGALARCTREGFTQREMLRRTAFYARRFARSAAPGGEGVGDTIKRTMFTMTLQRHLRQGIVGLANMGVG